MILDFRKVFNSLVLIYYFGILVASEIPRPRGVSISESNLYPVADTFTCFDNKLTVNYTQINDDYCDCADGSDEPGTSACPNGRFYCENVGFKSIKIPSSRVNDGICDCCDGSDEYATQVNCDDNCNELGKEEKEREKNLAELSKRGNVVRTEMSSKGKALKKSKSSRLNDLEQSIQQAEALKLEREQIKQNAEGEESAALEVYKQANEEDKKRRTEAEAQENRREAETTFQKFDSNQNGVIEINELQTRVQFDSNRDGAVSEDEAQYFMDHHDQVDLETFITLCWPRMKPYLMLDAGLFKPPAAVEEIENEKMQETSETHDEDDHDDKPDNEADDEREFAELQNEEDAETFDEEAETGEGRVEEIETNAEPEYDEETRKLIEIANEARNQFEKADRELRELESEKKQIEEQLSKDYGPHEEFAVLNGECFNFEDREYIYKLCPFDRAVQQPKNGGGETR